MTLAKSHSHSWTPEKLASLSGKDLETVLKNAVRLDAGDLIELCTNERQSRGPRKKNQVQRTQAEHSGTDVVAGYHFVCQRDRGVTQIGDDRFWSGSWVVAETNVRNSLKYGAYLALHESRSEMSYRQGQIIDYRRSARDMLSRTEGIEEGIEFLVQGTNKPYVWVGTGAGKKGYWWIKISGAASSESLQNEGTSP